MEIERKPDFSRIVDVLAFFHNEFGVCGCSDMQSVVVIVKDLLEWMSQGTGDLHEMLNEQPGVYYILVGLIDSSGLCGHSTSLRFPFLTVEGRSFLSALNTFSPETIGLAEGLAYDGAYYFTDKLTRDWLT